MAKSLRGLLRAVKKMSFVYEPASLESTDTISWGPVKRTSSRISWGDEEQDVKLSRPVSPIRPPSPETAPDDVSLPRSRDKYDYLGRNISAQERRQREIQWILVQNKKN